MMNRTCRGTSNNQVQNIKSVRFVKLSIYGGLYKYLEHTTLKMGIVEISKSKYSNKRVVQIGTVLKGMHNHN